MHSLNWAPSPTLDKDGAPDVHAIARWLAAQCATHAALTEGTAWRVIDEARHHPLALAGPNAPLVVQPRFSIWSVGQLGGAPLLHVLTDEHAARTKARRLANDMKVPVLVIDRGGEIEARYDPPGAFGHKLAPTLHVERRGGRWAVVVEGRIVATAPTREKARQRARALKVDPDFLGETPTAEA